MAEEPQIGCWEDFRAYVIRSDIRFVRPHYILRLRKERRVFPRRQEAEGQQGALFRLDPATQAGDFKYVAVSHCWESREHPDPYGFQLSHLAEWIKWDFRIRALALQHEPQEVVFFIDYVSLYQFGNRTQAQDASFRRSMEHMHLLYANSSADFCHGVLSISRLTPWWWKTNPVMKIPVFSNPVGRVQEVPLAHLRPTIEGRCSEECDDSCANLHANSTPYWHRGWCRAEVEWASPAIQDISYLLLAQGSKSFFRVIRYCPIWLVFVMSLAGMRYQAVMASPFILLHYTIAICIGPCLGSFVAKSSFRRTPGKNGFWPRSTLALSAQEFEEQVRTKGVAFTHRSDERLVVSLQALVYKQKLAATTGLSLARLARDDMRKLPGILLENSMLTKMALRVTFLSEADIEALAGVLCTKELETLWLESVPLCSRSLQHLCSAFRPQLRFLALSSCSLGDHHIPLLAECLSALPLEELDLSYNRIGNNGAINLAGALRSHPTLKCLDLSGNRLGGVGARALAEALMPNHAMEKLVLVGTWVPQFSHRLRPHQQILLQYHVSSAHAGLVLLICGGYMLLMALLMLLLCPQAIIIIPVFVLLGVCPTLRLWCVNCYGYILYVSSKLPDWILLFYDRLESSWTTPSEIQESTDDVDRLPFLS